MKHLRNLAWHPSWDETAKQLATQAAEAAVASCGCGQMPSGPTCACRRCAARAAMPKRSRYTRAEALLGGALLR
jgi:hypothetical protein